MKLPFKIEDMDGVWVISWPEGVTRPATEAEVQLWKENEILHEALYPRPEIKGSAPLILYFGTEKDREEFLEIASEALPNMKSYKV